MIFCHAQHILIATLTSLADADAVRFLLSSPLLALQREILGEKISRNRLVKRRFGERNAAIRWLNCVSDRARLFLRFSDANLNQLIKHRSACSYIHGHKRKEIPTRRKRTRPGTLNGVKTVLRYPSGIFRPLYLPPRVPSELGHNSFA